MGFALWIHEETAWCAGTHEYRPMGVAVISASALFTAADFHPARRAPSRLDPRLQGLFASLVDVNFHLQRRRSQTKRNNIPGKISRLAPIL